MARHWSFGCNTLNSVLVFQLPPANRAARKPGGSVWNFGHCDLEFICYLVLVIWNFIKLN